MALIFLQATNSSLVSLDTNQAFPSKHGLAPGFLMNISISANLPSQNSFRKPKSLRSVARSIFGGINAKNGTVSCSNGNVQPPLDEVPNNLVEEQLPFKESSSGSEFPRREQKYLQDPPCKDSYFNGATPTSPVNVPLPLKTIPKKQFEMNLPFKENDTISELPWQKMHNLSDPIGNSPPSKGPANGLVRPEKTKGQQGLPTLSFLRKIGHHNEVKMPTAPWMRGPLLLPADDVLDLSKSRKKSSNEMNSDDKALTGGVRGGRSKHAMRLIMENITKLKEIHEENEQKKETHIVLSDEVDIRSKINSSFSEGATKSIEAGFNLPLKEVSVSEDQAMETKLPWTMAEKNVFRRVKKEKTPTKAELSLPKPLLTRLRDRGRTLTKWVKVKKAGVTQEVMNEIYAVWKKRELAMLKFDVPLCRNMDRATEIVETKTGGLVVWRKKGTLVVYRGTNYHSLSKTSETNPWSLELFDDNKISAPNGFLNFKDDTMIYQAGSDGLMKETLFEREANRLLDELGPRFIDWWWSTPLPVDADLLPEVIPNFRPPLRLCPPHMQSKLTDEELTYLRKFAKHLPTHFALGKNTKLQGLAAAILKLWEKSLIAKIAIKWGIPNVNHQQMAYELKHLTGGVLLLQNKFFILLYRGKDFLPPGVANSIAERETTLKTLQIHEENARSIAATGFLSPDETQPTTSRTGTLSDFQEIQEHSHPFNESQTESNIKLEAAKEKLEIELRKQEHMLSILKLKVERSEKEMAKLNSAWQPAKGEADQETITKEEFQNFRKVGLKMDEVLLLGRRGVFDGVIGSIHQHWKHREVVKLVSMQKTLEEVTRTARMLETESGGILIAVVKLRKGHAIILYRGKNYRRPPKLLPDNLLSKKEAFDRSIEIQRRGSLKYFICQQEQSIWKLQQQLKQAEVAV
ncbi:chloroplastic group IIA intron splicing facilitator CRS1, chloroplastic isoform X2 [Amborella trichopoda]|uniref:chloroplastic group IIA intron splicing facilitator CRS1, chloroplastic isoform X2 n=1 Tax=Amborella trichopoda TaxID=13333 RepID=UPI0009C0346A|nr:chloroplastic group IIA intron splicing facilitator CRS1, chloroplastic isoform X2 [Amborella trichopoda]|eukprot:XP_020521625.1 chloroplastic group IIA intron splicing facilitator CRS1, chloroplastic isoform X2 [Amborella trichopoda]